MNWSTLYDMWPDEGPDYLVLVDKAYDGFSALPVIVQDGVDGDGFSRWLHAYWVLAKCADDPHHGHPFTLGWRAGHQVWIHAQNVILYAWIPDPLEWVISNDIADVPDDRTVAEEIKRHITAREASKQSRKRQRSE